MAARKTGIPTNTKEAAAITAEGVPTEDLSTPLAAPFLLGETLSAVSAKLVTKNHKGEYVDMAELLKDNIKIPHRKDTQEGSSGGNTATWAP